MADKQSLQQPLPTLPQSVPKKSWAAPEVVVIPLPDTLNNDGGLGDGDAALATES